MKTAVLAAMSVALLFGVAKSADAAPRHGAPHARSTAIVNGAGGAVSHRRVRGTPFDAYAQSPDGQRGPVGGYRWPYVNYDAAGNMIGPNPIQPDRW